jgi:hypothetical protein|nr:MAG TPA: hypothetical protein [Caudoviricetes sp.]
MKTDTDICKDIYHIVTDSAIKTAITGNVTYTGRETDKEDCVISVLDSMNGQIQDSKVNVDIYVQDITSNGLIKPNVSRISKLSDISKEVFGDGRRSVFGDGFRVTLEKQRVLSVNGKNEHVIKNTIRYKFNNE